jgi:hypothetical protein
VKNGTQISDGDAIPLDNEYPLVIPVMSAAGGVGRSTVAALLAAALHQHTSDHQGRAVAVCDTQPRSASPWPGWLDHAAERGTSWLSECAADAQRFAVEVRRSTSAIDTEAGRPIWVLTDTGPLSAGYSGSDPGPWFWAPALRYLRAAVIDGDPLEGFRLARHYAGGEPGTASAWMALPSARTAGVWVTDTSPVGLSRTLEAMTAAESCGLAMEQVVVVVNDAHGHGWAPRSRSRRTLLADRVGAIVEISYEPDLRRGDRPAATPERLAQRDVTALLDAVLGAAGRPIAGPVPAPGPAPAPAHGSAPAPAPHHPAAAHGPASGPALGPVAALESAPALAERTTWNVAHPVPAGG